MARYIDADKLIEKIQKLKVVTDDMFGMGVGRGIERVETAIEMQPTANVVEVVRCKDCIYKDDCAGQMVHTTRDYVLEQNISTYNKVDFCSYGERKQ